MGSSKSLEEGTRGVRLQLHMARCGVASRRACEALIAEGRVRVNGSVVREMGLRVLPGDRVLLDGKTLRPAGKAISVALHKPRGYICTNSDPQGRPLAIDLLRDRYGGRLFSIGRLDYLSSGLILFTNDGELARKVGHPSSSIEKEYLVETKLPVPEELLARFVHGVEVDGVDYRILRYRQRSSTRVEIVLAEGKNREIRNLFTAHRIAVTRVHRLRVGIVELGHLSPGAHRALTPKEVAWLLNPPRKVDGRRH